MRTLRETKLHDAWVRRDATFAEAADVFREFGISAIAVLDEQRRVVGLFTEDDLVRGLFPAYLGELRHTAFLEDDERAFAERLRERGRERVERHMRKPVTLELETSAAHAAERFLHCEWGALAVVESGRFVGMLSQIDFAREMCRRLGLAPARADE